MIGELRRAREEIDPFRGACCWHRCGAFRTLIGASGPCLTAADEQPPSHRWARPSKGVTGKRSGLELSSAMTDRHQIGVQRRLRRGRTIKRQIRYVNVGHLWIHPPGARIRVLLLPLRGLECNPTVLGGDGSSAIGAIDDGDGPVTIGMGEVD